MTREPDGAVRPTLLQAVVCILASAAAYYVSIGPGEFWPAAWVAPLPLLWLAYSSTWRVAAAAALIAPFLGALNLLPLLTAIAPAPAAVAALLVPAAISAAAALASRGATMRLPPLAAVLVFPAALTALEFLLSLVSPHGTIHSIAYSQTDVLPLLQLASLTGLWGMAFGVSLLSSALAVAIVTRAAHAAIVPAIALLVALGWGAFRVQYHEELPRSRVGLIATDEHVHDVFATEDSGVALRVAHEYAGRITRAARRGARIVVLPEKLVGVTPAFAPQVVQVFSDAARQSGVFVIAGVNRAGATPPRNVALVFGPNGTLLTEYDKRHMLPGPETGYRVGTDPAIFDGPFTRWGVAICKDLDFPAWLREYGRKDVRVVAVPAWDFVVDARLHRRMAVVRAVEQGFTLVRTAQQGMLTMSTGYGRILAETPSAPGPGALLVADVQAGPGATPYTRHGDWFAWSTVVLTCVLLLLAHKRAPRPLIREQHDSAVASSR